MNLEKIIKDNYNLDIINITKNEDSSDGNVYNSDILSPTIRWELLVQVC